jgi:hypothetical protein
MIDLMFRFYESEGLTGLTEKRLNIFLTNKLGESRLIRKHKACAPVKCKVYVKDKI